MNAILILIALVAVFYVLLRWYQHEVIVDTQGTVRLQSEHEHFHLHLDLPDEIVIQPGDTVHILEMPSLDDGRTDGGEVTYDSPVRLHKASSFARFLTKSSSIVEVNELVDHP